MRKKLLAGVLAASLVFSFAPVFPADTAVVASAEDAATDVETLTGTAWWTGNQVGKDYALPESGTLTLYVGYTAAVPDGAAFNVELKDSAPRYFTTGSNIDGWCDANTGTEGTVDKGTGTDGLVLGHMYKITVTRTGQDFAVEYYDVTDDKVYNTVKATGTNLDNTVVVHVMAQLGTYMVSTTQFEMPDVKPADPTEPPATPDPSTPVDPAETVGIDFSKIETQPAVKFTFDAADELTLAGEAKIEEGILKLATTESFNQTYAQLPDLTSYDFSNGVTLIADIFPTSAGDWTSIFMVGDGTIGGEGNDATALYHLTQGLSSDGGVTGNYFEGFFGNGNIDAVTYPYDYLSKPENMNKWHSYAVTITKDKMATYLNGVKLREESADYTNVLQAFKVAKNNYLGVSYWPADHDFAGSMDNVGIYTSALSAEDIAALSSKGGDTPGPVDPGPDDPTPDDPTPAKTKIKISKVTAKKNATKVTGTVSVTKATVKVKVGKKAYKKATVNGKKFTIKVAKLKKGTKITVKATKKNCTAATKSVTVK